MFIKRDLKLLLLSLAFFTSTQLFSQQLIPTMLNPGVKHSNTSKSPLDNVNLTSSSSFSIQFLLYSELSYQLNATSSDAFLINFLPNGNNEIDLNDAPKANNFDENLARLHTGNLLTVEERGLPSSSVENLPIFINQYTTTNYVFKSIIENLPQNTIVFLVDHYTGVSHQLYGQETIVPFSIDTSQNASMAYNRFSLEIRNISLSVPNYSSVSTKIYPNPSNGFVHITSTKPIENVRIYDAYGKLIYEEQNINNTNVNIKLKGFTRGVYFVDVITKNKHRVKKKLILKQT